MGRRVWSLVLRVDLNVLGRVKSPLLFFFFLGCFLFQLDLVPILKQFEMFLLFLSFLDYLYTEIRHPGCRCPWRVDDLPTPPPAVFLLPMQSGAL